MRLIVLLVFIHFITTVARAQTCAPNSPQTNLTTGNGSLALLPALDQKGTGLCYAYTISQLVDARRYVNPANRTTRISPLILGIQTPQSSNFLQRSRLDDGGSPSAALSALTVPGNVVCDDRYIQKLYGDADDQYTYFGTVELMFKQLREAYYKPCSDTPQVRKQKALITIKEMRSYMTASQLKGAPDGGMTDFMADLGGIVSHMAQLPSSSFGNYNQAMNSNLISPSLVRICEHHRFNVPPMKISGLYVRGSLPSTGLQVAEPKAMSDYAWNTLSRPGAQPVGIGFCSNILKTNTNFITPDSSKSTCGPHAAVLAGVRCIGGRRQFLLRNTWGKNCGSNLAARYKSNCDQRGNVWVDGVNLMLSAEKVYQVTP
jgi:hypothetical protein